VDVHADYALSASEGALRSLTAQHASTRALLDELAAHALLAPAPAPPAPKPLPATQQAAAPHAHCTPATAPGAATLAAAAGIAAAVVANPARAAGESEGLLRANGPEPHGELLWQRLHGAACHVKMSLYHTGVLTHTCVHTRAHTHPP